MNAGKTNWLAWSGVIFGCVGMLVSGVVSVINVDRRMGKMEYFVEALPGIMAERERLIEKGMRDREESSKEYREILDKRLEKMDDKLDKIGRK